MSEDYSKIPVPSSCPVCRQNIFQTYIKRTIKDWEDPDLRWKWWCQFCNSFFTWDAESRKANGIETRFEHGYNGNVDIAVINKGCGKSISPKLPDEYDPKSYDHSKNFE